MGRTPRDSKVPDKVLLEPFDVSKFGSEDDPCFGKLYSLTEEDCIMCGDHELCAIVFQNKAATKRIAWESENPALDMELDKMEKEKDIKEFVATLRAKGFKPLLVRKRLQKRFHLTEEVINKYL